MEQENEEPHYREEEVERIQALQSWAWAQTRGSDATWIIEKYLHDPKGRAASDNWSQGKHAPAQSSSVTLQGFEWS